MFFSIRLYRRFPVQCFLTSYGVGNSWVGCTVDAEPAVPNYTQMTMPLAVVIQDKYGKLDYQEIQP